MNISEIWNYDLRKGNTDHPRNGACLFDAGMWLAYGKIGDNPPCSCPVIRAYAVRLNDTLPDDERQRLKPFILRVVGNRDPKAEPARIRYIVLKTARRIVPLAYERRWPELAREMRRLPVDATYVEIRNLMQRASSDACSDVSAAAADAAAYAATCAAYAASDAKAATCAACVAYAYSDACSDAAAHAATCAAASSKVWDEVIMILDGVLRIGKQSPEFDEAEVRRSVKMFELACQ